MAPLQMLKPTVFMTQTEDNLADIRRYVERQLATRLAGRSDEERIVDTLVKKSEGVFLYASKVCEEILNRNISLEEPEKLPDGLGGVYFEFFQRQFGNLLEFRRQIRPILRMIVAAFDPLPTLIIRSACGLSEEDLEDVFLGLGSMFPLIHGARGDEVHVFHKTLGDWLMDRDKAGRFWVSEAEGHKILLEHGWSGYQNDLKALHEYFKYNLPLHGLECNECEKAISYVLDPRVLAGLYDPNKDPYNTKFLYLVRRCEAKMPDLGQRVKAVELPLETDREVRDANQYFSILYALEKMQEWQDVLERTYARICANKQITSGIKSLILNNLAVSYGELGMLDKALETQEQAAVFELDKMSKHDMAIRLGNLSVMREKTGFFLSAKHLGECAVALLEMDRNSTFRLPVGYHSYAHLLWRMGEVRGATKFVKLAYDGYRKYYNEEGHPAVAGAKSDLTVFANALAGVERTLANEELFERGISVIERAQYGNYAVDLGNTGNQLFAERQYEKALKCLLMAEELLAEDGSDWAKLEKANVYINIQRVRHAMGEAILVGPLRERSEYLRENEDGRSEKGEALIQEVGDPQRWECLYFRDVVLVGKTYLRLNRVDAAIGYFRIGADLHSCHVAEGEKARVAEWIQKCVEFQGGCSKESGFVPGWLFEEILGFPRTAGNTGHDEINEMEEEGRIREAHELRWGKVQVDMDDAVNLHNYAESCLHMGDVANAEKYQTLALSKYKKGTRMDGEARAYGNLGRIARCLKRFDESLRNHALEQRIATDNSYADVVAESCWNQAITQRRKGDPRAASCKAEEGAKVDVAAGCEKWAAVCSIERWFDSAVAGLVALDEAVDLLSRELRKIEGSYVMGHWLGSAYLACLLQRKQDIERAREVWNDTRCKVRTSGFKLVEWEMDALIDGGFMEAGIVG